MFSVKNPSPEYTRLINNYKKIHSEGSIDKNNFKKKPEKTYDGLSTLKFADILQKIIKKNKCKTLLDYGSGKGSFYNNSREFNNKIYPPIKDFWNIEPTLFDPGIKSYIKPKNKKFNIVISIDVLEHVPTQDLNWVLNEIFSFSNNIVFLNVACFPAKVVLDDGENAHVSLFHPMWWYGFITSISSQYDLKVFLICSYAENRKINLIPFCINEDINNYK